MDGGGSSTTVTNTTPPPTPEETELVRLNAELAKRQLDNIDALAPFQRQLLESASAELTANSATRDAYLKAFPPEQQAALAKQQADFQKQQFDLASSLAPQQTELQRRSLDLTEQDFALRKQQLEQAALDAPLQRQVTQANLELVQQQVDQAKQLQPVQAEILQRQLDQIKQGNRATPEQLQAISEATQAAIDSGTADIDVNTKRGIGLISDELANSRGLRLTDTPILREATLLTRNADDAKTNLVRSLRANEANAKLNYPLASQSLTNQTLQNQNSITSAAQNFQSELQNRAYQNRLALTGSGSIGSGIGLNSPSGFNPGGNYAPASTINATSGIGLGLAGIGTGGGALNALTTARMASGTRTTDTQSDPGFVGTITGIGGLAAGIGGLSPFFLR